MNRVEGQPLFVKDPNCQCIDPRTDFVLNPAAWSDPAPGQFGDVVGVLRRLPVADAGHREHERRTPLLDEAAGRSSRSAPSSSTSSTGPTSGCRPTSTTTRCRRAPSTREASPPAVSGTSTRPRRRTSCRGTARSSRGSSSEPPSRVRGSRVRGFGSEDPGALPTCEFVSVSCSAGSSDPAADAAILHRPFRPRDSSVT